MKIIQSKNFVTNPLVSVVVPSYNRANTILQTIDSITNQRCNFDFEIIIGDDCSIDNVREILLAYQAKYPEKIKLLFYDENIGLGANWATCIKECRGRYIANCDNDDYWHNSQKLQLQVDFMEQFPQYGLCHTDYRKHNRTTNEIKEYKCENISTKETETQQQSVMRGHFVCCNASVMYRRSVLLQYVDMDDYIKYRFTLQDWNTWMLLASYTEFGCLHVSTATFGIENHSITRPESIDVLEKRFQKEKECYKYICEKFPKDFPYIEKEYNDYVNVSCLNLSYRKLNYRSAKKYANLICDKSLKVRCTKNKLLFYFYCFAKKLKV